MIYEIKTQLQQDNELLKLDKEKKRISIIVSDPIKEKSKNLFKKVVYSYKVECPEIKTEVRRTYADFEWLRNILGSYYALRVVPPIMKEAMYFQLDIVNKKDTEEAIENAKIKYNVAEISVVHYLGEFYTGDSLFLVAVLGNHRGETLDALKEVIEKVKYDVEFKKEEISKQGTKTILAGG